MTVVAQDTFAATAALARHLLPEGVAIACTDPAGPARPLAPGEADAMARARPARRREFAAGRAAARAALAELGLAPVTIPVGPDRAPVWPAGITGSIAHGADACIAVAARRRACTALGVDLEGEKALDDDLWPAVLTDGERAALRHWPARARSRVATLFFAAKEAAFKAQSPLTGALPEFDDATVEITGPSHVSVRLEREVGMLRAGTVLDGRFGHADGRVLTCMALDARVAPTGP